MGQTVQPLENALRAWEDLYLIDEATTRLGIESGIRKSQDLVGPVKHWRELRNHLLMIQGNDFDFRRFTLPENPSDSPLSGGAMMAGWENCFQHLPLQLASWILSSRRVFQLNDELVERFITADYSHYKWSDLLWPFNAFSIQLESPVNAYNDTPQHQLTMLLVTSIYQVCEQGFLEPDRTMEFGTFYSKRGDMIMPSEYLDSKERDRLDDDLRHKRWNKVRKRLIPIGQKLMNQEIMYPPGSTDPYSVNTSDFVDDSNPSKIIAGLCLYLEALPTEITENYPWRQSVPIKAQREVRKIITDGEQVCQVNDFNVICPETISLFPETLRAGPAYSVTPHWRRGHYRRAKGQGKNPNAPRTIEVKPALIHKDLLPEGAVPGGAQSLVR
jgi:hypothetical protein